MFDVPSNPNIEKCIITKETVLENAKPDVVINENKQRETDLKNTKRQVPNKKKKESA